MNPKVIYQGFEKKKSERAWHEFPPSYEGIVVHILQFNFLNVLLFPFIIGLVSFAKVKEEGLPFPRAPLLFMYSYDTY